jgi:PAS domain S-box-containing protein
MKVRREEPTATDVNVQSLQLELERYRSALAESRMRIAKLEQSEALFRKMADDLPEVLWFMALDPEKVLYISPSFERIWGLGIAELYANPRIWTQTVHPDDQERVTAMFSRWIAGGVLNYHEVEYRIVQPGGCIRWIHERGVLSLDEHGKPKIARGISTDITEQKQAETLLAGEKRLLEMIGGGDALHPILKELCQLAEKLAGDVQVSILLVSADGKRLEHGAAPSLPQGYIQAINGGLVGPCAGSCGTAAYRGELVIVSDIANDHLWADFRDLALGYDLKACWSTPIFSTTRKVLGTFAFYPHQVGSPTSEQRRIVEQFAHLASIAIERTQAQEVLRRSEAYSAVAQRLSRTGSFSWRPDDGEITWSEEVFRIYEINPEMKPTLELARQRVHPDDLPLFEGTIQHAVQDGKDFEAEHRLLMPSGELKYIKVISRATTDAVGKLEFVGSLLDITEQKRLENQLRSSERNLAEGQRLTKTGSWVLDYETGNTDWSVETCRIFGFPDSPPSPHYDEFRARVRAEDRDGVDRGLKESFESGEPRPLKYVFILPDGTRKNIETISESVRDKTGKVIKLMGTVMDVTEREKAQEDMRASEKLARGQAEALTQALDALSRESSPDRIVEQVLRTFTTQLDAHSSSVWLRDEASGLMAFEFALEDGDFQTKANAQLARISPSLSIDDVWPWPEVFRTGKPYLIEDIRLGPDFPWRAHVLARGVVSILIVPMLIAGGVVGVIGIRFTSQRVFRREEMELSQALTNQVTLATQLIRLSEQSREAAVIAERNRMARDIHDALAQGFTGVIVQLEAAEDATSKGLTAEAQKHQARATQMARYGLSEARRSVRALRLQGVEGSDLCSALDGLLRRMTADTRLHSEFVLRGVPQSLTPEWDENLLRISQEVVTNALRHAHATHLKVRLKFEAQSLSLELRDDGCGFDPELRRDGFGLVGMKERVEEMGGHLSIQTAVGAGTTITITLPLLDNPDASEL